MGHVRRDRHARRHDRRAPLDLDQPFGHAGLGLALRLVRALGLAALARHWVHHVDADPPTHRAILGDVLEHAPFRAFIEVDRDTESAEQLAAKVDQYDAYRAHSGDDGFTVLFVTPGPKRGEGPLARARAIRPLGV